MPQVAALWQINRFITEKIISGSDMHNDLSMTPFDAIDARSLGNRQSQRFAVAEDRGNTNSRQRDESRTGCWNYNVDMQFFAVPAPLTGNGAKATVVCGSSPGQCSNWMWLDKNGTKTRGLPIRLYSRQIVIKPTQNITKHDVIHRRGVQPPSFPQRGCTMLYPLTITWVCRLGGNMISQSGMAKAA